MNKIYKNLIESPLFQILIKTTVLFKIEYTVVLLHNLFKKFWLKKNI